MARRAAAVLLWLTPVLAVAQTTTGTTFTIRESNDQDRVININECTGAEQDGLTFSWTISNFTVSGTYDLLASDQSGCPSSAKITTIQAGITANSATGAWPLGGTVAVPSLLSGLGISCTGSATSVYFCVNYSAAGIATATAVTGTMTLDLTRPPAPVANTPTAGDSALNVSWSAGTGSSTGNTTGAAVSYDVVVTNHADPNDTRTKTVTNATSTRVSGLQNGVLYDVVVYGFSEGNNESDASNTVQGTPVQVLDFWRLYKTDGGRELGGCSTGGAGLGALLALVPLALRRRRGRRS